MRNCLTFIFAAISLTACAPLSPVVPVENRSLEIIYQAALKESGTLRVAWGGDVNASGQGIRNAFESSFPGIKLDIALDLSKYLDGNIDLAYEKSASGVDNGVDVAVLQTLHDFPRWKSEGRLLPYKVAQWNDVYPQFVDPDGTYTGLYVFTFGSTVYNPDFTLKSSLPITYLDYLKPQWHDKIILTYPNDDDAVLFLFNIIIDKYGFDFIHSLRAQKARWVRGTATPSILLSSARNNGTATRESRSISFTSSSGFAQGVASEGPKDVYMTWPQTGAIFSSTKMPESAKLFLSFLMDDKWQQMVSENRYATRRSFDRAGVFDQTEVDPLAYGKFMADRQRVEALRFQLESIIGPPRGDDPVKDY